MTVFVETDFLLAIAKDDDWLQNRDEEVLNDHEVVTSPFAYLELLIVLESHQFDYVRLSPISSTSSPSATRKNSSSS